MVWYYCTLTIRESILRVNGSRIKGWWRAHHFISTALSAVLLTWPDSPTYHLLRNQLMWFYVYISKFYRDISVYFISCNVSFDFIKVLCSTFNSVINMVACIDLKLQEKDMIWISQLKDFTRGCGEVLVFFFLFCTWDTSTNYTMLGNCIN